MMQNMISVELDLLRQSGDIQLQNTSTQAHKNVSTNVVLNLDVPKPS